MNRERRSYQTAAELRSRFDEAFAHAPADLEAAELDLLVIRVAEHRYGVRLAEVLAIHADRKIVAAPGTRTDFLGLAGLHGSVVPVYDLSTVLGYRLAPAPRWLVLVRAAAPFALAFELFERHLRVPHASLRAPELGATQALVSAAADTPLGALAILDLPAIFARVTSAGPPAAQQGKHTS